MSWILRCYSVGESDQQHHRHLENGDKILLPASSLHRLLTMHVDYPLLFRLKNPKTGKASHCGVMEFSAEEGTSLVPRWAMDNLGLSEGDLVEVSIASLAKASFVKLRPHETAFVELSNPKAVLEMSLRGFSCLTVGDTIAIYYLGRKFCIDVCETRPDERAVSVIETDCEVDFATPLDYKEPPKPKPKPKPKPETEKVLEASEFRVFVGVGRTLKGGLVRNEATSSNDHVVVQNDVVMGSDGKRKAGKLVFGGSEAARNGNGNGNVSSGESNGKGLKNNDGKGKAVKEEEEKGFKAFSGKSYRLSR